MITGFVELLTESKRLPEVCVILKVDEKNFLSRMFNKKEVEDQFNVLMEKRREEKL